MAEKLFTVVNDTADKLDSAANNSLPRPEDENKQKLILQV
jgi:hypothetical protein